MNTLILPAKKPPKRLIFQRAYNMDEEDEYSPSEFYYPEDLETSNVEMLVSGWDYNHPYNPSNLFARARLV